MFFSSGVANIFLLEFVKKVNQESKFMKMYGIYESVHNLLEKDAKSEPEGTKESQKVTKVNQKEAKGSPKWATWRPKGAESEPRGDQNASKNRVAEQVAKKRKPCEP